MESSTTSRSRLTRSDRDGRYRALFDSIDQGFCVIDVLFDDDGRAADYRFVEVNAAFETQSGLPNPLGQTIRSLIPGHEDHWFERYGTVVRERRPMRFEQEAAALGRWFDVFAFPLDEPGNLVGVLFTDITERRRLAAERDELGARLAADLEAMGRLHELSTRLVRTEGLERVLEEILDATIALQQADLGNIQLFDADSETLTIAVQRGFDDAFVRHFQVVGAADASACGRALNAGERILIEDVETDPAYAPHRDAARRAGYRSVQSTPLFAHDGAPLGVLSTHFREPHVLSDRDLRFTDLYIRLAAEFIARERDDEAMRRARRAAEEASVAKSQFLAVMSHELRTPLAAIIGFADLMESEVLGEMPPRQREALSKIKASSWHLVSIIDEILTLSRAEAGKEEVHWGEADVAEIARDVVGIMTAQAVAKRVDLAIEGGDAPLRALTDAAKVRRILTNLIGNAVKYTDEGSITVVLDRTDPSRLSIGVRDTGPGIAPDQQERIFEPFTQVDSSNTRSGTGTGLGLAICRRLAQLLGGDVLLVSTTGAGSTFTLRLPTIPPHRAD